MKEYLLSLAAYNVWANTKMEEFIITAGENRCIQIQKSSFATIRDTLIHIWDAQSIWLDRLHEIPVTSWPGKDFQASTTNAAHELVKNSNVWVDMVHSVEESNLHKPVYYSNIKGEEFSNSWAQIIAHVMNHGTYHRGQLVTMLRNVGMTSLSPTDLIAYYREQN